MLNKILNLYNTRRTTLAFASGTLLGLLIGLLIGWVLWPTSYYNATPEMLRWDFRDEYLVRVAQLYSREKDLQKAQERLGVAFWKKENPVQLLKETAQRRSGNDAQILTALANDLEKAPPVSRPSGLARFRPLFQICGVGLLALALAALIWALLTRLRRPKERRPASERAAAYRPVQPTRWEEETTPPALQFHTTYVLGDDHYDPSFSIEKSTGEFMGECGVGISESIGIGDPKKVTALEIWMFDKNDIRTVTKVLASEFAYHDPALQAKLAPKGDLVLAEPDAEVVLETATLLLRARVTELEYGQGQLPPNSFFQRVSLELGVWIKEGEAALSEEFPLPPTL